MTSKTAKARKNSKPSPGDNELIQPLPRGAGRPPVRRNEIFDEIRERIVQGQFRPGGRVWTQREICRKFQTSPATAHAVLQDLGKAGFIYSKGARGTFVHDNPPFLHRYAVVCFDRGPREELYFRAIRQEALRLREEGANIDVLDLPEEPLRTGSVFELEARVARRLYRGLIFSAAPDHLLGTAILDTPDVERLSLSGRIHLHKNMKGLKPEPPARWLSRALERVRSTGRRRVGFLSHSWGDDDMQNFQEQVEAFGLETRRIWSHGLHYSGREEAARIIELLFTLPVSKRPNVLLIGNDNLTEQITLSLKECGIRIPVISHCNYPLLPATHVPVTWLGYDIGLLLRQSLQCLQEGKSGQRSLQLKLCFEEEVPGHLSPTRP